MEVVRGIESRSIDIDRSAVTIGFFDGVHRGHQAVIGRTVDVAKRETLSPVAVTFDRHPREVLTPGNVPPLLTTLDRKAALIEDLGVTTLVVLEFTEDLSRWSPEEFVAKVLVERLKIAHAAVGSNFTFGHQAKGNLSVLSELGGSYGYTVEGVPVFAIDDRPVSSSSIRTALLEGDLDWPTLALGRRFVVDGRIVRGAGRGAGLGFPTANLEVGREMLLPAEGVYAGKALVGGRGHVAAINVGTNPTFGAEPLHAEAFLLDFDGDILDQPMALEFWTRLRDEVRFESGEELARQIKDDVERTRSLVT
ncbi:MAG TPA: bifunctional riboflavin kinase/FAD synthetase, partial [Actinomycetota bacterium]|nr:bifunctional riboflavin kinase/FAD synthetase [Actinomycetota bacterium]